jgi:hypothetical protein
MWEKHHSIKQSILNINHIGDKQFIADYSGISE